MTEYDQESKNNVLHIIDYFLFRSHICIVTELLGKTLYDCIKSNNFSGFSTKTIKNIAFALLKSLKYLKRLKIIHCDLKPENILFVNESQESDIKLIDFGSSCMANEKLFYYIQSRFYRAPEVILGLPYDSSIDMWSFGCILAELNTGTPLFYADCENELIQKIMQIKGFVPEELLEKATKKEKFFNEFGIVPDSNGNVLEPLSLMISDVVCGDSLLVDLIEKCLE